MARVKINKLECQKCGHKWYPRKVSVVLCPNCKTQLWDKRKKGKDENTKTE